MLKNWLGLQIDARFSRYPTNSWKVDVRQDVGVKSQ